ncbi:hypothetical protein TH25_10360 [Thalassospira profundimaris]|uniref:Uncharacterized protein n=1 Tax=Thalassospira profundimaris TaxID=502049 RepID=A0A367XC15_9PROT|nr:cysteine protease StiP domain-containing protein [Thalassospira profundimaris]RCK50680.1 hypothetical protein TH25_10360 [Thalassospira profundimaris]
MSRPSQLIKGSYDPEDVKFLLKQVEIAPTDIATKEKNIQSGTVHYSEMISQERRPDARYLQIFETARQQSEERIAREISGLAQHIVARIGRNELDRRMTLCSLVRAGVPYGVLLHRELTALGVDSRHFGMSIIRDRGLDGNALDFILAKRPIEGVVFVDGWTGKGAISTELTKSWQEMTGRSKVELAVLADPSGFASMAGSYEDWLIPSGILGANVSGLISRSILNRQVIGPTDFHGSIPVNHLADIDISLDFVNRITALMPKYRGIYGMPAPEMDLASLRMRALACINRVAELFDVDNINRIKPGIAEATRAVLRRRPKKVIIRSLEDPDLAALIHLCRLDKVELLENADLTGPYRAITLIEKMS